MPNMSQLFVFQLFRNKETTVQRSQPKIFFFLSNEKKIFEVFLQTFLFIFCFLVSWLPHRLCFCCFQCFYCLVYFNFTSNLRFDYEKDASNHSNQLIAFLTLFICTIILFVGWLVNWKNIIFCLQNLNMVVNICEKKSLLLFCVFFFFQFLKYLDFGTFCT